MIHSLSRSMSEERERSLQLLAEVSADLMASDWEDTNICFRHILNALFVIESFLRYHTSGETVNE